LLDPFTTVTKQYLFRLQLNRKQCRIHIYRERGDKAMNGICCVLVVFQDRWKTTPFLQFDFISGSMVQRLFLLCDLLTMKQRSVPHSQISVLLSGNVDVWAYNIWSTRLN
jgi:hypothetical protein